MIEEFFNWLSDKIYCFNLKNKQIYYDVKDKFFILKDGEKLIIKKTSIPEGTIVKLVKPFISYHDLSLIKYIKVNKLNTSVILISGDEYDLDTWGQKLTFSDLKYIDDLSSMINQHMFYHFNNIKYNDRIYYQDTMGFYKDEVLNNKIVHYELSLKEIDDGTVVLVNKPFYVKHPDYDYIIPVFSLFIRNFTSDEIERTEVMVINKMGLSIDLKECVRKSHNQARNFLRNSILDNFGLSKDTLQ